MAAVTTNRGVASVPDDLAPFVSELARTWALETPEQTVRTVRGSLVFADISGFTRLTERLAAKGRIGAEEMSDHLDAVLTPLLSAAYDRGGWLVKWGGDALLLMFDAADHPLRAASAASAMRSELRRVGSLTTSVGRVRLRMSIGLHEGEFTFHLVGNRHRELLITGAAATLTARLEATADAGEILMSPALAALLPAACRGAVKGEGVLLARPPVLSDPAAAVRPPTGDVSGLVPELVLHHLRNGGGSEEHRPVAVGFVEFAGLEQLGPSGADAVHTLIDVIQAACHRFRVSFHETDISPDGGKVMLVAGAPRSLEDPAGAMLWTLRQVFDQPSSLSLRAGVSLGRAFTGAVGPARRRSYSVKGDVVNLAARIMGRTAPGEIWATPALFEAAHTRFDSADVPPFTVKGKSAPVSVRSVGRALVHGARSGRDLPLVGRSGEMQTIRAALADARAGIGAHVDLIGPAGIGKTRLLAELAAVSDGARTISVTADLYRSAAPYALIRPLLATAIGLEPNVPVDLADQVIAWCREHAGELVGSLALLAPLLDAAIEETAETRDIASEFRAERAHALVCEILRTALAGLTVLIVDNLQFADEASIVVLRRLAGLVEGRPWLIVLADRAESESSPLRPSSRVVVLDALSVDESRALVDADTEDEPLRPHVAAALVRRAGGNPLFLRQLVATRPGSSDGAELPDSIESVVVARIEGLPPAGLNLLRAVAVNGMSIDRTWVAELLDTTTAGATSIVQSLGDFLTDDIDQLTFRQPVIRDAVYESMPFRRRAHLHSRLAQLLTARSRESSIGREEFWAVLSLHHFRAGQYAQAFPAARTAADQAARAHANAEAALLYRRALAAAGPAATAPADRAAVSEQLGDVEWQLGEYANSDRSYSSASRLLREDPLEVARIGIKQARSAERRGAYESVLSRIRRVRRALDAASGDRADDLRMRAELRAGFAQFRRGRLRPAHEHFLAVVERGAERRDPEARADALAMLDVVERNLGQAPDGERARQAVRLFEQLGDLAGQGRVWTQIGYGAYFDGRWDEATAAYGRGRELFERVGDVPHVAVNDANLAEIYLDQGHLDRAEAALRSAVRVWRAAGAENDVAFGHTLLGRVLSRQGRFAEAQSLLEQARTRFAEQGAESEVVDADTFRAECWQLQGLTDQALDLAVRTLATAERLSPQPVQAPLLNRIIGACHDAKGDWARGDQAHQDSLAAARRRGADHEVTMTVAAMARRAHRADRPFDQALIAEVAPLKQRLGLVVELA